METENKIVELTFNFALDIIEFSEIFEKKKKKHHRTTIIEEWHIHRGK